MTDQRDFVERSVQPRDIDILTALRGYGATEKELRAADEIERLRGVLVHSLGVMLNEEASKHGSPPAEWSRTCGMGVISESLGLEPTLDAACATLNKAGG